MIVLTRAFLLFLLVVDWKEDTYFGTNINVRPMASTEVCPVDFVFRDGTGLSKADNQFDAIVPATTVSLADPFEFSLPLEATFAGIDLPPHSLYVLMSLQL